ncbi:N-acetylmuramoyl-L-alanine amidase CwlD [Paenibacillus yanchengensis]|uniref:N-acetylmuramoyl-L-alanine amidase CwlD n=1 Tax=Paenibacillus yanchengensis TaxID=2035833 RepID=A0ABW4YH47_9BACL
MGRWKRHVVIWLSYKGMLRLSLALVAVVVVVFLMSQRITPESKWTYFNLPLANQKIVIDAGHGGVDGGAVSKQGLIEKDLNLAIALQLRDYLQQSGATVVMTREGDYDLASADQKKYSKRKTEDLLRRAAIIKKENPTIVISVHMNSVPSPKWSGAQTFYYAGNQANGMKLAELIQEELRQNLQNTSRSVGEAANVYLLKEITSSPMALVEVGFLSHPEEAVRLADAEYQRKVAASIYQGVLRFSAEKTLE